MKRLYGNCAMLWALTMTIALCGCDDSSSSDDTEENSQSSCTDEVDNDKDGALDCDDAGCFAVCEMLEKEAYTGPVQVHDGRRGQIFNSGWRFIQEDVLDAYLPAYDDSEWRELDLPHDWSVESTFYSASDAGSGGGFLDGGVGWYRKMFTLPAWMSSRQIHMTFDGVYMNGEVWINGKYLGKRPYGYSSFEYDITPYLNFAGENTVSVRVENHQPNSRWYSGTGIYRNVWLTAVREVHVPYNGVFVTTPSVSEDAATVSVTTEVQNDAAAPASVIATVSVYAPDGTLVVSENSEAVEVAAGETASTSHEIALETPALWSTSSPNLYQVKVELSVDNRIADSYTTTMGLRWFTFDPDTGFTLNGKSMRLRGVNMHHDLGALGSAINVRAMERQVEILKAMGVNAIRLSHNPPAPEYLDVCDRMGIVVIDEAFDCWEDPKTDYDYNLYFEEWSETDIKDMVKRDRNHPSVIAWSIGNEIYEPSVSTAEDLIAWVKEIDSTRPLTWASHRMNASSNHVAVADLLDLQGYNYKGDLAADHAAHPDWVMFGSEVSAAVRSRGIYYDPDVLTQTNSGINASRQCSSYDNETSGFGTPAEAAFLRWNPAYIAGWFVWSGFDYIGEPTPYSSYPSKNSYYGIIDTAGFPKDIYYFYQSFWTAAPMVHLLPHWNWSAGETVRVYAYTNCDSVELFLNDNSLGEQSIDGGLLHVEWDVNWASGALRADCINDGEVVATDQIQTAGAAQAVSIAADRESIAADGLDLIFVTVEIVDGKGAIVPTAENNVAFAVSGPGKIVGVDNGNAIDTTSYKGTSKPAFSGKVLAIIQSTGAVGEITVTAVSEGLTAGEVTVPAE